eukprot:3266374-Prymnesium_polylepis.1
MAVVGSMSSSRRTPSRNRVRGSSAQSLSKTDAAATCRTTYGVSCWSPRAAGGRRGRRRADRRSEHSACSSTLPFGPPAPDAKQTR